MVVSVPSLSDFLRIKAAVGEDTEAVIWNIRTGKKHQIIAFPYGGQVSVVLWISGKGERKQRLAFGCADGSIHIWVCVGDSVSI